MREWYRKIRDKKNNVEEHRGAGGRYKVVLWKENLTKSKEM